MQDIPNFGQATPMPAHLQPHNLHSFYKKAAVLTAVALVALAFVAIFDQWEAKITGELQAWHVVAAVGVVALFVDGIAVRRRAQYYSLSSQNALYQQNNSEAQTLANRANHLKTQLEQLRRQGAAPRGAIQMGDPFIPPAESNPFNKELLPDRISNLNSFEDEDEGGSIWSYIINQVTEDLSKPLGKRAGGIDLSPDQAKKNLKSRGEVFLENIVDNIGEVAFWVHEHLEESDEELDALTLENLQNDLAELEAAYLLFEYCKHECVRLLNTQLEVDLDLQDVENPFAPDGQYDRYIRNELMRIDQANRAQEIESAEQAYNAAALQATNKARCYLQNALVQQEITSLATQLENHYADWDKTYIPEDGQREQNRWSGSKLYTILPTLQKLNTLLQAGAYAIDTLPDLERIKAAVLRLNAFPFYFNGNQGLQNDNRYLTTQNTLTGLTTVLGVHPIILQEAIM